MNYANTFWFLLWPILAGLVCGWHCYTKEGMRLRSSIVFGIGVGLIVIGFTLAMIALD